MVLGRTASPYQCRSDRWMGWIEDLFANNGVAFVLFITRVNTFRWASTHDVASRGGPRVAFTEVIGDSGDVSGYSPLLRSPIPAASFLPQVGLSGISPPHPYLGNNYDVQRSFSFFFCGVQRAREDPLSSAEAHLNSWFLQDSISHPRTTHWLKQHVSTLSRSTASSAYFTPSGYSVRSR